MRGGAGVRGGGGDDHGVGGGVAGKRDLVVGLQVMLETGELRVAAGLKEGDTFVRELMEMRVKVGVGRHEQFGAWREGTHDDLVLAAALACWRAVGDHRARGAAVGGGVRRRRAINKPVGANRSEARFSVPISDCARIRLSLQRFGR